MTGTTLRFIDGSDQRSRLRDTLWLVVLVPAWVVCFALCCRDGYRDTAFPSVSVQYAYFTREPFPIVLSPNLDFRVGSPHLEAGDRLLRWGGHSLAHLGQAGYFHVVATQTPASHVARVTASRDGHEFETEVETLSFRDFVPRLPAAALFFVAALILHLRAPATPTIRSFVWAMWGGAFVVASYFGGQVWSLWLSWFVWIVGFSAFTGFVCRAFLLLAQDHAPLSRWQRGLPWLCATVGPLDFEGHTGVILPQSVASISMTALGTAEYVFLCVTIARTYRRADPIGRRKLKWMVWGLSYAFILPCILSLMRLVEPAYAGIYDLSGVATAFLPLSLLIAVFRFNLFDVDRVISRTAFYSAAGVVVVIAALGVVPKLTAAVGSLFELPEFVVHVGITCLLVLALVAAYRSFVPAIERRLHSERVAFEAQTPALIDQQRSAGSPREALQQLASGLAQSLRPVSLGIYFRSEEAWESAHALGTDSVPVVSTSSPLLRGVERTGQMRSLERGRARPVEIRDPYDQTLIASLKLSLVLPVCRDEHVFGVILLGRKASGDVYVDSELALLLALSHVLAQRLAAFEWQSMADDARQLRRYVPGAVATEIVQGGNLEPEELDVAVMFVDMRGYAEFSEGRAVSDVFSIVNQYTQLVSAIVAHHGGHVVEFNGDGMLVIFGAPKPLVDKEACAVEAALQVHADMRGFRQRPSSHELSVGIGIATGPTCVGSLRAVDRWIWTAIGETTNRAARLQSLTRDLQAEIIVDEVTWSRLAERQSLFAPAGSRALRGLHHKHNLFVKPLDRSRLLRTSRDKIGA